MQIIKAKGELKGTQCYDILKMAFGERKIKGELRQQARMKKEKGKLVKVEYRKLLYKRKKWVSQKTSSKKDWSAQNNDRNGAEVDNDNRNREK